MTLIKVVVNKVYLNFDDDTISKDDNGQKVSFLDSITSSKTVECPVCNHKFEYVKPKRKYSRIKKEKDI